MTIVPDAKDILTALDRALWVIDHAIITDLPKIDETGQIIANSTGHVPGAGQLAHVYLASLLRTSSRGLKRRGLTVRLWLALQITAAITHGTAGTRSLHTIATGNLPRPLQWDLGILTSSTQIPAPKMLTEKQMYKMNLAVTGALDPHAKDLTADEQTLRQAQLEAICNAIKDATLVIAPTGTSYAIDESGVWAWTKGPTRRRHLPAPVDVDLISPERRKKLQEEEKWEALDIPEPEELEDATDEEDKKRYDLDEDFEEFKDQASGSVQAVDELGEPQVPSTTRRTCNFAAWGTKTHKNGRASSYFGYALHAIVRVPEFIRTGREMFPDTLGGPHLVQEFTVTAASTDIVAPSMKLVHRILAHGHKVQDFLGDRHYSYKKFERWALPLWKLKVRPVIDLRANERGATDYLGAQIIDGTPHCSVPQSLRMIPAPGLGASRKTIVEFEAKIAQREPYSMKRNTTAWSNKGKTQWTCPARAGKVGCPNLPGSVAVAHDLGLPVIDPPEEEITWCKQNFVTIPAIKEMKHHQEFYFGSPEATTSRARRTHIESVFGNLKNHKSGNIHRGFLQTTGAPMVTLALTAAISAYNLKELENWFERASVLRDPDHFATLNARKRQLATATLTLLDEYEAHPLHATTEWIHGYDMLTREQMQAIDQAGAARNALTRSDHALAA